ncbi:head maturation protease, ClpP-related [Luteolibacter soli]|uniref:ATP-dependent Clp protease proteolytic subunit n=1 Tax=Luteolibacter soli TaxID=3135280 RepID=A0ABU9B0N2_9BACT
MPKKKKFPELVATDELLAVLDKRPLPAAARRIDPENRLPKFEVVNAAAGGKKKAAIHILDAISWWTGNDARTFQQRLAAIDADEIDLYLNSPGGSVFEGVTIYNLLVAHKATVTVHVLGLAASIASVIALAGDTVHIAENAMFMIHNPSAGVWGEAEELRKVAGVLDKITESILNTYEERTKLTRDQLRTAMAATTYYTADEAVTSGFATAKVASVKAAAALWSPDDFPELSPEALALAVAAEDDEEEKEEEEPTGEAGKRTAPPATDDDIQEHPHEPTLDDVHAAEDLLKSIRAEFDADD